MRSILALLLGVWISTDAFAETRHGVFYNLPGQTTEGVRRDEESCRAFAANGTLGDGGEPALPPEQVAQYGLGGIIGIVIVESMRANMASGQLATYFDDCMVARGYRRFEVSESARAFAERFEGYDDHIRQSYLASSTPPEGTLTRDWQNQHWLATQSDAPTSARPPIDPFVGNILMDFTRELEPEEAVVGSRPAEAIVVVTLDANSTGSQVEIVFAREAALDAGRPEVVWQPGRRPTTPTLHPSIRARRTEPATYVYVVPAGIYSIASLRVGSQRTQFCLGTPYVSLAPGSVTFLGRYSVGPSNSDGLHDRIRVDLESMALPNLPQMETARFSNGLMRACVPNNRGDDLAGIDLPGAAWAPYEQARARGSRPITLPNQ